MYESAATGCSSSAQEFLLPQQVKTAGREETPKKTFAMGVLRNTYVNEEELTSNKSIKIKAMIRLRIFLQFHKG